MWFKNIQLFLLAEPFKLTADEFNEKLLTERLRDCGKTEQSCFGWTTPFSEDHEERLVHAYDGCFLFALGKDERILPAAVVREAMVEKIKAIETQEDRKIYAREKANLRDETTFELLPKAFTKKTCSYAYIDTRNNWIVVDSTSRNKAEELVAHLRDTLGSLKVDSNETKHKPHTIMSQWLLQHHCPSPFLIEDNCELLDIIKGVGSIKCKQQDLSSAEVRNHIRAGKQVTSLSLSWADKLYFTLCDDLSIKGIRTLDILQDRMKEDVAETLYERQLADYALMTSEFSELIEHSMRLFNEESQAVQTTQTEPAEA